MKIIITLVIIALGSGAAYWFYRHHEAAPTTAFRTAAVIRGDLAATISATGTVEPEEVVDVGAQVAGRINFFGSDPGDPGKTVDYGSNVEVGTVLAQIDDSLYAADVATAQATLESAKATRQQAEASLGQMHAKMKQAEAEFQRSKDARSAISKSDYDTAEANYEVARSNLAAGDASIAQGKAQVAQAQAALDRAKRNLGYCTIASPVKGVVIDRRVNIGQTVVSSLNTPSLFLIAKDLHRIQVWASVNEADIGNIRTGQTATFTVDAYPGRVFKGAVNKVRLNATTTQNVVTYTVEVTTDNADGKLLPYLTANVQFDVTHDENVLLAPNAALRWFPKIEEVAPDARAAVEAGLKKRAAQPGGAVAAAEPAPPASAAPADVGYVWNLDGPFVRPVKVRVGLTDGTTTEIGGGDVREGMTVVLGEQRAADNETTTNPFAPNMGGKKK